MINKSHRKIPLIIKIVLVLGVLYVLWRLPLSDAAINAVLAFFFAGVVPGTDIIISSDVMIKSVAIAGVVMLVSIILSFSISYWLIGRRMKQLGLTAENTVISEPAQTTKRSKIKNKSAVRAKQPAPVQPLLTKRMYSKQVVRQYVYIVTLIAKKILQICRYLLAKVYRGTRLVAKQVQKYIVHSSKAIQHGSRSFWTWIKPLLRRADVWLEAHIKSIVIHILKRMQRSENGRFIYSLMHESKGRIVAIAKTITNKNKQN